MRTTPCGGAAIEVVFPCWARLAIRRACNVCATVRLVSKPDLSWSNMLDAEERDATAEEIAGLEEACGPILPSDGEG